MWYIVTVALISLTLMAAVVVMAVMTGGFKGRRTTHRVICEVYDQIETAVSVGRWYPDLRLTAYWRIEFCENHIGCLILESNEDDTGVRLLIKDKGEPPHLLYSWTWVPRLANSNVQFCVSRKRMTDLVALRVTILTNPDVLRRFRSAAAVAQDVNVYGGRNVFAA